MDIRQIPSVMRRRYHWERAARLMERWFNGRPNSNPEAAPPERSIITLRWAMGFERFQRAHDRVVHGGVWFNAGTRQRIERWLRSQSAITSQPVEFGLTDPNRATARQLRDDCIYQESVGSFTDPIDEMYAALGRFELCVIVRGTVRPEAASAQVSAAYSPSAMGVRYRRRSDSPVAVPRRAARSRGSMTVPYERRSESSVRAEAGSHRIVIHQIGVYLWDSYDFNGRQVLGFWSPEGVSAIPRPGYETVTNGDFRRWRAEHGHGCDFCIVSNVECIRLGSPVEFAIPGSPR